MFGAAVGLLLDGVRMGLGVAAPLGPINLEIIRRGLADSPFRAWIFGMGAVTADSIYLVLAFVGMGAVLNNYPSVAMVIHAIGALLLLWLGYGALRTAFKRVEVPTGAEPSKTKGAPAWQHYTMGLALTITSPMTFAFWLALSTRVIEMDRGDLSNAQALFFLGAGVLMGAGGWCTGLALALALARHRVSPLALRWASGLGGAYILFLVLFPVAKRLWGLAFGAH